MKLSKDQLVLVENWLMDLRKKSIDPVDRASIIKGFLVEKGLSQRGLASLIGVPKSTVEDWLLYSKVSKSEVEVLKSRGFSKTDVYRTLRNNKGVCKGVILDMVKLDEELKRLNVLVRSNLVNPCFSAFTAGLISETVNNLNRLLSKIERCRE